jgi:glutathione synthase/RimK-type ligase-like ATP-grasp enzyme
MILVCGSASDPVIRFLCERLTDLGKGHRLLDLSRYPSDYKIIQHRGDHILAASISASEWTVRTDELTGVFVRSHKPEAHQEHQEGDPTVIAALRAERELGLESLLAKIRCPVINRFENRWSNQSKPHQVFLIRGGLLRVPCTLITNDLPAAQRFYEEMEGKIIQKSASARSTGTRRLTPISLRESFSREREPLQLQEFIEGEDIRVHVVADQVFSTLISSGVTDYRLAEEDSIRIEPVTVPVDVAAECVQLTQGFGLLFSGIDLRLTPNGEYYCFEVNTSPGFAFYETRTGQRISTALAELLSGESGCDRY